MEDPLDAAADGSADASPDAARACDRSALFGAPVRVGGLNGPSNEWGVGLSPDARVAVLGTDRAGGDNNIYIATRDDVSLPFGTPAPIANVSNVAADGGPKLSADGLEIYFHSDRAGSLGGYDLFVSSRTTTAAVFGVPTLVANVNDSRSQDYPFVTPNGDHLYFATDGDLVMAARGPSGMFGAPTVISSVNSAASEMSPVLTPDELTIFFARGTAPDFQMMTATRSTTADGFGPAVEVAELNTNVYEFPQAVSGDGCSLYFVSNGQTDSMEMDVYVASRPR